MTSLRPDQCWRLEAQILPEVKNQAAPLDVENQVLNTSSLREGPASRLVRQENRALNHLSGKAKCAHSKCYCGSSSALVLIAASQVPVLINSPY